METKAASSLPSWFVKGDHKLKVFVAGEEKGAKEFEEMFKEESVKVNVQVAKSVLSSEEIDVIVADEERIGRGRRESKRKANIGGFGVGAVEPSNRDFRIIYATRTHSQIHEFLQEFKRSSFSSTFSAMELASRKNYCLNDKVQKYSDSNYLMKEKCLETRLSKDGCQYYNYTSIQNSKFDLFPIKTKELEVKLKPDANGKPKQLPTKNQKLCDIEDIVTYFKPKQLCPYYCTKENAKYADVARLLL